MNRLMIFFPIFLCLNPQMDAQTFQHNMEESLIISKSEQKNILMLFSGSDWCKSCIQLKNDIISSEEFVAFSNDNLILLELDFPYRKKNQLLPAQQEHNEQLAEEFNPKGMFPRVVLLDSNKQVLGQVHYRKHMSVNDFIQELEALN